MNTHHRDFDDRLVYKTTRVYTKHHKGDLLIVADRVLLLPNNKYSTLGNTTCIHVRDIENYTNAYNRDRPVANFTTIVTDNEDDSISILRLLYVTPSLCNPIHSPSPI